MFKLKNNLFLSPIAILSLSIISSCGQKPITMEVSSPKLIAQPTPDLEEKYQAPTYLLKKQGKPEAGQSAQYCIYTMAKLSPDAAPKNPEDITKFLEDSIQLASPMPIDEKPLKEIFLTKDNSTFNTIKNVSLLVIGLGGAVALPILGGIHMVSSENIFQSFNQAWKTPHYSTEVSGAISRSMASSAGGTHGSTAMWKKALAGLGALALTYGGMYLTGTSVFKLLSQKGNNSLDSNKPSKMDEKTYLKLQDVLSSLPTEVPQGVTPCGSITSKV
jgi:hypothetical protein